METNQYRVNCDLSISARVSSKVYDKATAIADKWEPVSNAREGTCGNLYGYVDFKPETGRFRFVKDWSAVKVHFYEVMPSALWLYRLLCHFAAEVESYGPEGYKSVWSVGLRHKSTGRTVAFSEHKAAAGFYMQERSPDELEADFKKDLLDLLNLLVSKDCPHPYDGTVAGTVA